MRCPHPPPRISLPTHATPARWCRKCFGPERRRTRPFVCVFRLTARFFACATRRKSGRNEKNPHAGHHQQQEHAHRDEQVEGKEGANATELLDEGPRLSVDASGLDGVGASTSETRYATSLGCPKGDSCIPEGRESDYHHVADIQESVRRATFQLEIALSLLYEDDGEGNNGKVIPGLTDPEGLS